MVFEECQQCLNEFCGRRTLALFAFGSVENHLLLGEY